MNTYESHIKTSQKLALHSIFECSNSDESSIANLDKKRSNTPSEQLSEINNLLHKSEQRFSPAEG